MLLIINIVSTTITVCKVIDMVKKTYLMSYAPVTLYLYKIQINCIGNILFIQNNANEA